LKLKDGDAVFFVCGRPEHLRPLPARRARRSASDLGLVDDNRFAFCWIVDFPMFEWNDEEKKIDFSHNPFSMPNYDHEAFLALDPADKETILPSRRSSTTSSATAWSCRRARSGTTSRRSCARPSPSPAMARTCWRRSSAACCARSSTARRRTAASRPAIDRIVMLLCGEENLREVTMFPMNQRAEDLMMGAPSDVSAKQLRELHIRLDLPK
jgi:aspartyl-tRNA synthetase